MFFRNKKPNIDPSPQNPKKSYFYLMGLSGEELNTPIHIHFDSFESAFQIDPNAVLNPGKSFECFGTFLVTLFSPNFGPKGHTCRVAGVNHKPESVKKLGEFS